MGAVVNLGPPEPDEESLGQVQICQRILNVDTVGTVYHLVIYMQSNKIHNVVLMSKF